MFREAERIIILVKPFPFNQKLRESVLKQATTTSFHTSIRNRTWQTDLPSGAAEVKNKQK
jgi:hypothetical protein